MTIGFFDSGIGGATVLYEALKILPNEDYIYYADTLHVPYGPKPKEEVREYIFEAVGFLVNKGVDAIVIACNTATSIAVNDLRKKYSIPIIGMEPAVKPAVEINKSLNKRVLVTATELTLKEEKLQNLISKVDNEHVVDLLPLPGLVKLAESMDFNEEHVTEYLKMELSKFDLDKYETIVLGCTHFSFFKDFFKEIFSKNINIIDGNQGTVRHLKRILEEKKIINNGSGNIEFYNSKIKVEDKETLEKYKKLFELLDRIK